MPAADARSLIEQRLGAEEQTADPLLDAFLDEFKKRYGESLLGVLLYGSYLRGERDSPLDFYVLVDRYAALPRWQAAAATVLPPNVYHIHVQFASEAFHAKCATLRLKRFETGVRRDFHSYFWARFAQPTRLAYARNADVRARILDAVEESVRTFVRRVTPILAERFSARDLWTGGLAMTYRCELRSEGGARAAHLFEADPTYFEGMVRALEGANLKYSALSGNTGYASDHSPSARRGARLQWWLRRLQGKLLSVARLTKAATTFDAPLDYLLWKIERHSGIKMAPTARQRRYPLIFAWPLLWRLYRRGGFR